MLFHIYDGNFVGGSGDPKVYGPEYLMEQGIMLVLPNYRLGPLGFLCLQDDLAPGNAALKDLSLALNWVKKNIAAFKGDPEKITVSAEGKAGALVGLLALSTMSNHLFNKAITESGSALAPWALDRNPETTASQLINALTENSKQSDTNVLKDADVELILLAAKKENIIFKPCVEKGNDYFINNTTWGITQNDSFIVDMTFMIGSANKSGMHEAEAHTNDSLIDLNSNYDRLIPKDLVFPNNDTGRRNVANNIKKLYFKEKAIAEDTKAELALLYTDSAYLGPSLRFARLLSQAGGTVYFYEFSYDGDRNWAKLALNSKIPGAARGDILGYVFRQDNENHEDEKQNPVTEMMIEFWTNFITKGYVHFIYFKKTF